LIAESTPQGFAGDHGCSAQHWQPPTLAAYMCCLHFALLCRTSTNTAEHEHQEAAQNGLQVLINTWMCGYSTADQISAMNPQQLDIEVLSKAGMQRPGNK
jgi:hypothetical protein